MTVSRFVPILASFAVGAAVSWWVAHPVTRDATEKSRDVATLAQPVVRPAASGSSAPPEMAAGIPPDSATPAKPAPNAGERRAILRAIDRIDRGLPVEEAASGNTEPRELTDEETALIAQRLQAHLTPKDPAP